MAIVYDFIPTNPNNIEANQVYFYFIKKQTKFNRQFFG
jgi:hypothetical protein